MRFLFALIFILTTGLVSAQVQNVAPGVYTPGFRSVPNYVKNPSCFANVNDITTSGGGAIARSTSSPLEGVASCSLTSTTAAGYVQYALKTLDNALSGRNCEVVFTYSSSTASNWKVYAYDTTNSRKLSQDLTLTDVSSGTKEGYLIYPCGDLSNTTVIRFEALATPTSAMKVGRLEHGLATRFYTQATVTDWQSYTPTFTGFGTVSTQSFYWRQVGANIEISGRFQAGTTTATEGRLSLPSPFVSSSSLVTIQLAGVVVQTTSSASSYYALIEPSVSYITFGQQNGTNAGLTKQNGSTFSSSSTLTLTATIPVQGLSGTAQTVVAPSQSNYDWTAYTPTFTGFGTVSSSTCYHKREGSTLHLRCRWTAATSTATEGRISLPNSLNTPSSVATLEVAGSYTHNAAGATGSHGGLVFVEPSVGYVTFSDAGMFGNNSITPLAKATADNVCTGTRTCSLEARVPISGWSNPGMITATLVENVTSPGISKPVIVSAYVDASEVVTGEDSDFLTTCTNADPAVCSFTSSYWASAPKCWAQGTTAADLATVNSGTSTSSVSIDRGSAATPFALWCTGARP